MVHIKQTTTDKMLKSAALRVCVDYQVGCLVEFDSVEDAATNVPEVEFEAGEAVGDSCVGDRARRVPPCPVAQLIQETQLCSEILGLEPRLDAHRLVPLRLAATRFGTVGSNTSRAATLRMMSTCRRVRVR